MLPDILERLQQAREKVNKAEAERALAQEAFQLGFCPYCGSENVRKKTSWSSGGIMYGVNYTCYICTECKSSAYVSHTVNRRR